MSRFAYHTGADDLPLEGGVRAATPKNQKRPAGKPHAASNGVPGPEETLLDITELVRNIGMQYVHRFALPADYEPELNAATPIAGKITLTNAGATLASARECLHATHHRVCALLTSLCGAGRGRARRKL
ncbi:MAG: hypothetical protein QM758_01770 [Armatimonas sp.]